MKNNFKRNLLIGFSASLIILILSAVASYVSINNLLKSAALVNHTNEVIREMRSISTALLNAETGQRGYLLTSEDEFLAPYLNARERAMKSYGAVKALTSDNAAQQQDLEKLYTQINGRFKYLDSAIELKKQGQAVNAQHFREGRKIMENVRDLIALMEERENQLLSTRYESMSQFVNLTPPLIIAGSLIALLITVLFYTRVRADFEERVKLQHALEEKDQEISNRISIIRGISDKISQGNYSIRIDDKQSDALGNVAGSLNKMAESLQYSFTTLSDKEWLQTGIATLNDVMIGEKDVESLGRDIIECVATYTGANVGVLYILEGGELHSVAGFSYLPAEARRVIKLGEGIVGQCVIARNPVELKNIPVENITISFASGEARPNHVIALPVLDGHTIKGAIELATLTNFAPREIEFMRTSTPFISIFTSNVSRK